MESIYSAGKKNLYICTAKKLYKKNPQVFLQYLLLPPKILPKTSHLKRPFHWEGLFRCARPDFLFGNVPGGNNVAYLFS